MNFTFGIISDGTQTDRLNKIVDSIESQEIPDNKYEIIIVADQNINRKNTKIIPFDENIKKGWISRKKNLIAQNAAFENLCLLHDYLSLDKDWYKNFLVFGNDWSHCICRILDQDGFRYRDWVTFDTTLLMSKEGIPHPKTIRWINYDDNSQTKIQYISGAAYCIKTDWALKYPINEEKMWGNSEDVEVSWKWRDAGWNLKCNPRSIFRLGKEKECWPPRNNEYNFKQDGGIN